MAEIKIARFLSSLATESRVSPSTHNQALNAILFLPATSHFTGRITGEKRKPSSRIGFAARLQGSKTEGYLQTGYLSYAATFFCDSSAAGWL
jgi:hypothetical protein